MCFICINKIKLFIVPTVPANLKARAVQPGELHVTWDPPNQPNGNVTHYEVYWRRRELDPRSYAPRDYCHNRELIIKVKHRIVMKLIWQHLYMRLS